MKGVAHWLIERKMYRCQILGNFEIEQNNIQNVTSTVIPYIPCLSEN